MSARLNLFLAACLVACAMFLVNAQHQARRLFVELERVQAQSRQLEVEGRQLQLEQSRLAQHARIEALVKRDLNMTTVRPDSVMYLTPEAK
ncbi:MAG: cell division protein FtsL [Oxalobacter sp.]|jgi:cell division protein FtsL|nr:MAG: cell division protein FtsL [Oxalobacter sp.]